MSEVGRIKVSEDVYFTPNDDDLFDRYNIKDPAARVRIERAAVDALYDYEKARARQVETEKALGEQAPPAVNED